MSKPAMPEITEKAWQKQVEQLAKTLGWEVYHTFLSRWSDAGFPDLVLARASKDNKSGVHFVELKSEKGKLTISQERWRDVLLSAGASWYCWRPSQWDEIVEILR